MSASDARLPWPAARSIRTAPAGSTASAVWASRAAVALCVLAALVPLTPVIRPGAWLGVSALVAVGALWMASGLRTRGVAPLMASTVSAGAIAVVLVLGYARDGLALGLVPTGDTLTTIGTLVGEGVRTLQPGAPPVEAGAGLSFLLVGAFGLFALLLDAIVFVVRAPAVAGLPLGAVLALPSILVPDGFSVPSFVLLASAYAFLLRTGVLLRSGVVSRGQRPVAASARPGAAAGAAGSTSAAASRALMLGTVVVAGSVLLPPLLPSSSFVLAGPYGSGGSGGAPAGVLAANPIVALGEDLRRPDAEPALAYTTTDDDPGYLRMAVLTDVEPQTWVPSAFRLNRTRTVDEIAKPPGLSSAVAREDTIIEVEIAGAYSRWLPAPYPARSITGLEGDWFWEPDALSVRATDSTIRGQSYRVEGVDVRPTRADLATARPADRRAFAEELSVPTSQFPAIIAETALEVTSGLDSDYDRALAIQSYLRNDRFSYSESAPVSGDYDGSGPEVVARFLAERSGYCVHFSSAMALMARVVGIPARIGVGYTAGSEGSETRGGEHVWEVDSRDAHAWPELYFDRVGWVPFEPTPGRGSVPAYAVPEDQAGPTQPDDPEAAAPEAAVPPEDADEAPAESQPGETAAGTPGPWAPVTLLTVALLLAPALARAARRALRFARLRAGRGTAADAWRELTETAVDLRLDTPPTDTPRAFAERLGAGLGDESVDALDLLRRAFERESFGRPSSGQPHGVPAEQGAALAGACDSVRRELTMAAPPTQRAMALLLPVSVLPSKSGIRHAA